MYLGLGFEFGPQRISDLAFVCPYSVAGVEQIMNERQGVKNYTYYLEDTLGSKYFWNRTWNFFFQWFQEIVPNTQRKKILKQMKL